MKKIQHEQGQSLVEMAVSLVLLLLLLSGAVEFGMAFFQFIQLRDAAQEGAFYGSIDPTNTDAIASRTKGASNSPIDLTIFTKACGSGSNLICITYTGLACEDTGNAITVTLTYDHRIFMPFMSGILGRTTIPLKASVTDTILSPGCT
jgi:Flp pilus assembly protein TadG